MDIINKYDIELSWKEIKLLKDFLILFKDANSKINLSAIREDDDIIEKHFIDSIILKKYIDLKWNILDLWTWWGFPWIPLSIVDKNNSSFVLVDSIWKKIKVVNDFCNKLWLKNIIWIQARAEELWRNIKYRETQDYIVSRATAYLPTLIEYTIPLLKVWWVFISYKTNNYEEIKESKKALKELNAEIIDIKNYSLWWQDRVFIFIKKLSKTSSKYPRNIWEPLKNPLV